MVINNDSMNNKTTNKNAGKGMAPKKGYDYKKWSEGWDHINWKEKHPPLITVKIDKNTTGILYDERTNGRTEEISGSNG